MKRHWLWVAIIPLLLAGCHTEVLYNGTYPSTPTRWPDNVETCGITVSVFPGWHKAITWTGYPSVNGYQDVGGGGCGGRAHDERVVEMEPLDVIGMSPMGVDHGSGGWNDYAVFYEFHMGPPSDFQSDHMRWLTDPNYRLHTPGGKTYAQQWRFNIPLVKPRTEIINGLEWKHVLFFGFDSHFSDPTQPGIPAPEWGGKLTPPPVFRTNQSDALSWVGEVYTLQIDKTHQMKIWAQYNRPVVQDAHWLMARGVMLRKLVNAVTVKSLTRAQITQLRTLAAVQQSCYAGSVEACKKGGLRTEYATQ